MSLKFDINFKTEFGWINYKFWKESNWNSNRDIGTFDVKELTAGIKKYGVKMEHPSGKVINANEGVTCLVYV